MKYKNYLLIKSTIDNRFKEYENIFKPSSVDFWLKMARKDESFGSSVSIIFEYDSNLKQVIMTKYESICFKDNSKITIRLQKKIAKMLFLKVI